MRKRMQILTVMLWGQEVGKLTWHTSRNQAVFRYHPDFLKGSLDLSPLSASITSKRARLPIYGEEGRKYQDLPAFLADSLPDDWGNELFEQWRSRQKITQIKVNAIDKLSFIGQRAMGALEFIPDTGIEMSLKDVDLQSLIDLAQRIFTDRQQVHIDADDAITLKALIAVGTSAGGRQPKAVLAIHPETHEIRSGQIAGLEGFEYYLMKFGDAERSSAELEMAYYDMAQQAGIDMMPSRLIEVEGKKHFLTQRFDRKDGEKLHTQTLAALYPGADSYEMLLAVCRMLRLTEKENEEVFRRLVFNVLANNTDDHDKNFSFIMDRSGHWSLSPAYDMTFIFNRGGFQPETDHCLMIRGKRSDFSKADLLAFARDNGIRKPESIINEIARAISAFSSIARKYGVKEDWVKRISHCLSEHLHAWGYAVEDERMEDWNWTCNGHHLAHPRIVQAYKGNLHLTAEVDGKEKTFIIRQKTELYTQMMQYAVHQPDSRKAQTLIAELLLPAEHP